MNPNNQQAYDRGVSVFSPEGRLYQVEYAREAVKRGSPSVGLVTEDGIVLATKTKNSSDLVVDSSIKKIHKVEEYCGAASSGYAPDGRKLVDQLRLYTQNERLRYGEDADISTISEQIADHIQELTQTGGRRPYGSSLIIGGVDDTGSRLYHVEPGGTPTEWKAVADGNGRDQILTYFEKNYDEGMELSEGIRCAIEAINSVSDGVLMSTQVDIATITEEAGLNQFTNAEVAEYME